MENQVSKNILMRYSPDTVDQPIVYNLVMQFGLIPNILRASVSSENTGYLVLRLTGTESDHNRGMDYLLSLGLSIDLLSDRITWDKEACTQCGACTALCPTQALSVQRPDMQVSFDGEKCVVCHICLQACPVRAVHLDF